MVQPAVNTLGASSVAWLMGYDMMHSDGYSVVFWVRNILLQKAHIMERKTLHLFKHIVFLRGTALRWWLKMLLYLFSLFDIEILLIWGGVQSLCKIKWDKTADCRRWLVSWSTINSLLCHQLRFSFSLCCLLMPNLHGITLARMTFVNFSCTDVIAMKAFPSSVLQIFAVVIH